MLLLLLHTRKKRWRRLKNSRQSPHISLEKFKLSANSDCFTFHNRALGKREKCVCVCTTRGGRACSCRVHFNMGLTKISLRRGGGQKRSFSAIWRQRPETRLFFCGKSSDPLPKQTQGTATNPRLIQVWSGSGQTLGHRFAYDAVKSEQHGATLHYPFSWDEGDGTGSHDF